MQFLPRWRYVLMSRTSNLAHPTVAACAFFHSSPNLFGKWKNKFNLDSFDRRKSGENIRYVVREKRADAKKALRNILLNGGCSAFRPEMLDKIEAEYENQLSKKNRIKSSRQAKKGGHKKLKRKHRRENLFKDDEEDPENIFQAKFGFSFNFHWTESWSNNFNSRTRSDYHDDAAAGTCKDRKILDLPTTGPLRIEDVKAAFRMSALKWHPDRHQGSSEAAAAEEKFKHCVTAYKSLCEALSDS